MATEEATLAAMAVTATTDQPATEPATEQQVESAEEEAEAEKMEEDRPAVPQVPFTAAPTAAQVPFPREAFVTLVTSNAYAPGALVLANALRAHHTEHLLACMVTPGLHAEVVRRLRSVFHHIHFVDPLDSFDSQALQLLGRPELGVTLTKLHVWRLTQYDKVVFMDADTFPLRNVDELFAREELSAASDIGWPDCFNSGVFVLRPSLRTYTALLRTMSQHGSFDGGDQGLLNTHFSDWSTGDSSRRLPFIYNVTPSAWYSYAPAFARNERNIAILHFIGEGKPWRWQRDIHGRVEGSSEDERAPGTGSTRTTLADYVARWWAIHDDYVESWRPSQGPFIREKILAYSLVPDRGASAKSMASYSGQPMHPEVRQEFSAYRVEWSEDAHHVQYQPPPTVHHDYPPAPNFHHHHQQQQQQQHAQPWHHSEGHQHHHQHENHHHHHHHQQQHSNQGHSEHHTQYSPAQYQMTAYHVEVPFSDIRTHEDVQHYQQNEYSQQQSGSTRQITTTTTTTATSEQVEALPVYQLPLVGPRTELIEPHNWVDWAHQLIDDLRAVDQAVPAEMREQLDAMLARCTCQCHRQRYAVHGPEQPSTGCSLDYALVESLQRGLKRWERELLLIEHLGFRRALTLRGEDSYTARMAVQLAKRRATATTAGDSEESGHDPSPPTTQK